MLSVFEARQRSLPMRLLNIAIIVCFSATLIIPPTPVQAQALPQTILNLPLPGTMLQPSAGYIPAMVKGITVNPENPLALDFIIDKGQSGLEGDALESESLKLIKYFLAALTVPENELWVNLSPYEGDRIIPQAFSTTEMGRDLLAQDYILKQLTASLMYPEEELGQTFWKRVRAQAHQKFGTTDIPLDTFNKVWIVPQDAMIYETGANAYIIKSRLKVMLEEDYFAVQKNMEQTGVAQEQRARQDAQAIRGVTKEMIKEILIPEIEKEVNEGENFANLRQIYNSLILAAWFKRNLQQSLLGQVYANQNKVNGINDASADDKIKIYNQYLQAFKKGVYNYIKEEADPFSGELIPRKYFSGGFTADAAVMDQALLAVTSPEGDMDALAQEQPKVYAAMEQAFDEIMDAITVEVNLAEHEEDANLALARAQTDQAMRTAPEGIVIPELAEEFQGALEKNTRLTADIAVQFDTVDLDRLERQLIDDLFTTQSTDSLMITAIRKRIRNALYAIGQNFVNRTRQTNQKNRRFIFNRNDPSYDESDPEDGTADIKVGIFPIAANPVHWGHLEPGLRAMAQQDLDQIVIVVQGDDYRKPILRKTEQARHEMVREYLEQNFGGLIVYSDWSRGNENIGEETIQEIMLANQGRPGRVEYHYLVGNDHKHFYAPAGDSKDKEGNVISRSPKLSKEREVEAKERNISPEELVAELKAQGVEDKDIYQPDTIQVLLDARDNNPELKELFASGKASLKVAFNVRDWQDGVPMAMERDTVDQLTKEGFIYEIDGLNLPDTSSTKLRKVLAGELGVEEAAFITQSLYEVIMKDGKYRGLITKLDEVVRELSDKIKDETIGLADVDQLRQLVKWLQIEEQTPSVRNADAFYGLFYRGINKEQHDVNGKLVQKAEPELYVNRANVRKVFAYLRNNPVEADAALLSYAVEEVALTAEELSEDIKIGTSGWRGLMTLTEFNINNVSRMMSAVDKVFVAELLAGNLVANNGKRLKVGLSYGGRKGSLEAAQQAARVLTATDNVDVFLSNKVSTTPAAISATSEEMGDDQLDIVFHFDASHNDARYNGVKMLMNNVVAPDSLTSKFTRAANDKQFNQTYLQSEESVLEAIPTYDPEAMSYKRYAQAFQGLEERIKNFKAANPDIQITLDALHGASPGFLNRLKRMGVNVIRTEPMKNRKAPKKFKVYDSKTDTWSKVPFKPEPVKRFLSQEDFQNFEENAPDGSLYMAIDGDADRLAVWVKHNGKVEEMLPNELGVLFASYLIESGRTTGRTKIVKTQPTTHGLTAVARTHDMEIVDTPVGSKWFAPHMDELLIATEESGHQVIAIGDQVFFDDAVVQAMLFLEIMAAKSQSNVISLSDYKENLKGYDSNWTYYRNDIDLNDIPAAKDLIVEKLESNPRELAEAIQTALDQTAVGIFVTMDTGEVVALDEFEKNDNKIKAGDGIHLKFDDDSWVQFRLSGTEPIVRLYAEGPTAQIRANLNDRTAKVLQIPEQYSLDSYARTVVAADAAMVDSVLEESKEYERAYIPNVIQDMAFDQPVETINGVQAKPLVKVNLGFNLIQNQAVARKIQRILTRAIGGWLSAVRFFSVALPDNTVQVYMSSKQTLLGFGNEDRVDLEDPEYIASLKQKLDQQSPALLEKLTDNAMTMTAADAEAFYATAPAQLKAFFDTIRLPNESLSQTVSLILDHLSEADRRRLEAIGKKLLDAGVLATGDEKLRWKNLDDQGRLKIIQQTLSEWHTYPEGMNGGQNRTWTALRASVFKHSLAAKRRAIETQLRGAWNGWDALESNDKDIIRVYMRSFGVTINENFILGIMQLAIILAHERQERALQGAQAIGQPADERDDTFVLTSIRTLQMPDRRAEELGLLSADVIVTTESSDQRRSDTGEFEVADAAMDTDQIEQDMKRVKINAELKNFPFDDLTQELPLSLIRTLLDYVVEEDYKGIMEEIFEEIDSLQVVPALQSYQRLIDRIAKLEAMVRLGGEIITYTDWPSDTIDFFGNVETIKDQLVQQLVRIEKFQQLGLGELSEGNQNNGIFIVNTEGNFWSVVFKLEELPSGFREVRRINIEARDAAMVVVQTEDGLSIPGLSREALISDSVDDIEKFLKAQGKAFIYFDTSIPGEMITTEALEEEGIASISVIFDSKRQPTIGDLVALWVEKGIAEVDAAMDTDQAVAAVAPDVDPVGGIDLDPAMMDLQIKRDANGVPLPIFEQPLEDINIQGFIPVIINIQPIPSVPLLLGIADFPEDTAPASDFSDTGEIPFDRKARLTEGLVEMGA